MKLKELLYGRSDGKVEEVPEGLRPFGGFRPRAEIARSIKLKLSNERRAKVAASGGSGIQPRVVGDVPVVQETK